MTTIRLISATGDAKEMRVSEAAASRSSFLMSGKRRLSAAIGALGAEMTTGKPRRFQYVGVGDDGVREFREVV